MALEVFYSYAHVDADVALRDELEKHLSLLKRSGHIVSWHDRRIGAGDEWRAQIDAHARSAQIILLLISPDFVSSDYCYDIEMKLALERHARHEAIVIPIILRPVDWSDAPFARLQALPRDAKAVTTWLNRDEAFMNIAQGIREVVVRFGAPAPANPVITPGIGIMVDTNAPKARVLDAAIPSHVVKGQPAELQVLIRLPDSPGLKGILLADDAADARPEDVLSKDFKVRFPVGPDGRAEALKARVQLTSPDFDPSKDAKQIFVPPDEDSEVVSFLLTPLRTGKLKVLVELQWEDTLRGARRLLTECVAETTSVPANVGTHVVRIPLEISTEKVGEATTSTGSVITSAGGSGGSGSMAPQSAGEEFEESNGYTRMSSPPPPAPPAPSRGGGAPKEKDSPAAGKSPRDGTEQMLKRIRPLPSPTPPYAEYQTAYPRKSEDVVVSYSRTAVPARLNITAILIAIVGAIPIALGSYWQWVYKPAHIADNKVRVTYSGQVLNARTKEFVPDARVTVHLESGRAPVEGFTDSRGGFTFDLGELPRGTLGKVYVRADTFGVLEKNFVVEDSGVHDEFRLEPVRNGPARPKTTQAVVAGRVVDAGTNVGIGQAGVTLAGRPEKYLTDDTGNFRIEIVAPFPKDGVRVQVKKAGCATVDEVVRPPTENVMLEMRCRHTGT